MCSMVFHRAATNCDLYVLSKKSLDETVKYYPDICKQIKKTAAMRREELLQKTHKVVVKKKDSASDILLRDTGCKFTFFGSNACFIEAAYSIVGIHVI